MFLIFTPTLILIINHFNFNFLIPLLFLGFFILFPAAANSIILTQVLNFIINTTNYLFLGHHHCCLKLVHLIFII